MQSPQDRVAPKINEVVEAPKPTAAVVKSQLQPRSTKHVAETKIGGTNLVFQRGTKLEAVRAGQTQPVILRDKILSGEVNDWNMSPDGRKIIFSATPEDVDFFDAGSPRSYVFTAHYNTSQQVVLAGYGTKASHGDDAYTLPSYDPSGQKIVVTRTAWETFDAPGPTPTLSQISIFDVTSRHWLWDSQPIAYKMSDLSDKKDKYYSYSLHGGVMSPDGNQIICLAENGHLYDDEGTIESREKTYPLLLVDFNLKTRQGTVLAAFRKFFSSEHPQFTWHPNSSRFALVRSAPENNANLEIYDFNLKTKQLTRLTHDECSDFSPSWAPDGKSLFWIRGTDANIFNVAGSGANQIMRASDNGENTRVVFPNVKGATRLQAVSQLPKWEKYHQLAIEPLVGKYQ